MNEMLFEAARCIAMREYGAAAKKLACAASATDSGLFVIAIALCGVADEMKVARIQEKRGREQTTTDAREGRG